VRVDQDEFRHWLFADVETPGTSPPPGAPVERRAPEEPLAVEAPAARAGER
jgi:hypothetical protein